ncbi:CCA tRNA nucleotidyltransferase [Granulicella sp. L46]|uniref:CCA tRNA nucleotidyltransferase n=1 Tax=Granulicella sp. L46 TaxID=1641865 RepID=UPI00131BFA8E|nr:CCA tRNA nucleotidyltransferase [Granulicella sp. L46]
MADYIYLLQTRLTPYQQSALEHVRQVAKARAMTVFLVGGAVRDLTSGSPIRDLDFAVQGNATKLKKELQKAGGVVIGEDEPTQTLYFTFPGGVRLEVGSTLWATYPKPGKPVYKAAPILDDLHRRDFTANAMALSLNDGSFGLLMDPLNGVADIENRELRLVSNYGFIEDPARMIRAARFGARLGWQMEEKTRQRYENAKADNAIAALSTTLHHYELEEVFHEEDPLRVLKRLEAEGWAKVLFPAWTSSKANEAELDKLRDLIGRLESMGISPDPSAAYFPLLTAKLTPKDVADLKKKFARPGFAEQIPALEADTKEFATLFTSKAAAAPSDAWKMLFAARPEAVLWLAHTTKSAPLKARFEAFFNDWSQARLKIPYQLMQEMRITPALPGYNELVEKLFFAVMDSKLDTPEAARAFLEPFSPPAPPPPVNMRRRAVKREAKVPKPRGKKAAAAVADIDLAEGGDTAASAPVDGAKAKGTAKAVAVAAKAAPVAAKALPVAKKAVADKAPVKAAAKKVVAKPAAKKVVAKPVAKKLPAKPVAKKAAKPVAKKVVAKKAVKAVAKKVVAKKVTKPVAKKAAAPAKKKPVAKAKPAAKKAAKPVAKKVAGKPKPKAKR